MRPGDQPACGDRRHGERRAVRASRSGGRCRRKVAGLAGNLAKESNALIVPANAADIAGVMTQAMAVVKGMQRPESQPLS